MEQDLQFDPKAGKRGSKLHQILDNQIIDRDFLDQLSRKELKILRGIVKKVHMQYYPEEFFDDAMADMLISKFGAEWGEKMIKRAVDGKLSKL